MIKEGKNRVIIENVMPKIDHGRYPAKSAEGEEVRITASIFADGHDYIRAHVVVREPGKRVKNEIELKPTWNDEWEAFFITAKKGTYTFTIEAWIDHFLTWHNGFIKKADAGQRLETELMEGALLLKRIAGKAKKTATPKLQKYIEILENKDDYGQAVKTVQSADFKNLVEEFPLKENVSTYEHELHIITEHKKANFSAWYEFFPRSASTDPNRGGTFKDCEKLLPRIASMGFDVLYFPPIHPIGEKHRKGKNNSVTAQPGEPGSPWAIGSKLGGHKAISPELGTLEEYKNLIKKAKAKGIDIALDIAFQCAPDHPYVKEHPQWFKWRPDGTVQYAENPPKKYQDILPFDFECEDWQNLWKELKSVVTYWIDQGVRIFRVDNPHTKPIQFWEWLIAEVNKEYEDIIFLSEAFTRPKVMASLAKVGFTQGYTYFTWRNNKQELEEYMNELVNSPSRYYFRPNFWPNTPDILPYILQQQNDNTFIYRYALAATLSSNFGVYGPVYEFFINRPVPNKEEYWNSEKYEIQHHDWKRTNRMTDIMTAINKARNEHAALQSTWNISFCELHNEQMMAYLKKTPDKKDIILMVVNLDSYNRQNGFVRLPWEQLGMEGDYHVELTDLITNDHYTWTNEWNFVELDPYAIPFHLFHVKLK